MTCLSKIFILLLYNNLIKSRWNFPQVNNISFYSILLWKYIQSTDIKMKLCVQQYRLIKIIRKNEFSILIWKQFFKVWSQHSTSQIVWMLLHWRQGKKITKPTLSVFLFRREILTGMEGIKTHKSITVKW